jgi:hypothetical protein
MRVAVHTEQNPEQICVLLDKVEQVNQKFPGTALDFLGVMALKERGELEKHLLLQIFQEVKDIVIVQIKGAAVDVGELGELPYADILDRLFQEKRTETAAQCRTCLSDSSVWSVFTHKKSCLLCYKSANL